MKKMTLKTDLDEALTSTDPGASLEDCLQQGQLDSLPEIAAIVALGEDSHGLHKDVWQHTKAVVSGVPNLLELRWSALFHDIGKAKTRRLRQGKVTFHNHDVVGARQVSQIQARLKLFEPTLEQTIRVLVLNHLRPASYRSSWTDSAVRRLVVDLGGSDGFKKLMHLSRADLTTKRPEKQRRAQQRADSLEARVAQVLCADNRPKLPKGTMGMILDRAGLKAGPWLKEIQSYLEKEMEVGTLEATLSSEEYATIGFEFFKKRSATRIKNESM